MNYKKNIVVTFLLALGVSISLKAQLLIDRSGTASFFSEAPIEDIKAVNKKAMGAIDLEKGTLAVSIPVKSFHFEKSLMEEHFNENYLESDQYPNATFKGTILNLSELNFSEDGNFEAEIEGTLEIHGVKKPFNTKVKFEVLPTELIASTVFNLSVAEFDIEVPKLVIKNIAEVVEVKALFNFIRSH